MLALCNNKNALAGITGALIAWVSGLQMNKGRGYECSVQFPEACSITVGTPVRVCNLGADVLKDACTQNTRYTHTIYPLYPVQGTQQLHLILHECTLRARFVLVSGARTLFQSCKAWEGHRSQLKDARPS